MLRCIKYKDCLGDGWHPVCAGNKALNVTGAFPNYCYMRCANRVGGWAGGCRVGWKVGRSGGSMPALPPLQQAQFLPRARQIPG